MNDALPSRDIESSVPKPMWNGGPIRMWSARKTSQAPMSYADGGFVGSYVCTGSWEPCDGLYLVREEQKWLCGPCKRTIRPLDAGRESVKPVQPLEGDPAQDGAR
jgi:hypothetical protein